MTQVFINGKGTFMFTDDKNISKLYSKISAPNKNGLRLAFERNEAVEIVSNDACKVFETYDSISEPDENGVRIAKREVGRNKNGIVNVKKGLKEDTVVFNGDILSNDSLIYALEGLKTAMENRETLYALLPQNFGEKNEQYKSIKQFENDNYLVTLENGKQEILNKRGNDIAGGMYHRIQEVNALGEVVANRTKSKSKGGIVLIHDGKRFKKVDNLHRVLDSAPIGIKALKYGQDLNKNVVAGVDISRGIEIDEDVNRVLIALLKNEKPQPRFWKSIEENGKFDALAKGVEAYGMALDEIAMAKPELEIEIAMKKQNLVKSLQTLIKRKIAGHKSYENTENRRISKHKENISNSSNRRNKLEELNDFEPER